MQKKLNEIGTVTLNRLLIAGVYLHRSPHFSHHLYNTILRHRPCRYERCRKRFRR